MSELYGLFCYWKFFRLIAELPRAPKAPAGGASIAIELIYFGKSIKPRKFGSRPRPYVRTYARIIRPADEFIFVLDLESFLRKK